jgi:DNA-binding NarL/FixJ family response regulator
VEGSAVRVVVADAEPALREGVRLALENGRFAVCAEARSATAAVRAVKEHRPDLCLVDVALPGGGVAAVAEMRSAVPDTAVVVLTSSADEELLLGALEAGARGYLVKDIAPARLPGALEAVMRGEVALPRSLVAPLVTEYRKGSSPAPPRIARGRALLTKRELEVLALLREGLHTREIGLRLAISQVTVRRHISTILAKLGVSDRAAAVRSPNGRS